MKRNKRIAALDPYRKPAPRGGAFAALTWQQRRTAEKLLWRFCQRWAGNLPQWRRAILTGVAKRLAGVDVMAAARAAKVSNKSKTARTTPLRHLDL